MWRKFALALMACAALSLLAPMNLSAIPHPPRPSEVRERMERDRVSTVVGRSHFRWKAKSNAKKQARRLAGKRKYRVIDIEYERERGKWNCTMRISY